MVPFDEVSGLPYSTVQAHGPLLPIRQRAALHAAWGVAAVLWTSRTLGSRAPCQATASSPLLQSAPLWCDSPRRRKSRGPRCSMKSDSADARFASHVTDASSLPASHWSTPSGWTSCSWCQRTMVAMHFANKRPSAVGKRGRPGGVAGTVTDARKIGSDVVSQAALGMPQGHTPASASPVCPLATNLQTQAPHPASLSRFFCAAASERGSLPPSSPLAQGGVF